MSVDRISNSRLDYVISICREFDTHKALLELKERREVDEENDLLAHEDDYVEPSDVGSSYTYNNER